MSWLYALWFFLPAGVANAAPVIISRLPLLKHWKTPLDFEKKYRGIRLLGPNKTVRGVVGGTLIAAGIGLLQQHLSPSGYPESSGLIGAMLGFGALFGDAVESFFKRQVGISSGKKWFPFDQVDYIIGAILFSLPVTQFNLIFYLQLLITWFGMHLLFAYIGYKLGLKDTPI